MMEYQGYIGKVEFDDEAGIFHGEVIGTRDVITFQGQSVAELKTAFQESIDDYLAFCKQRGEEPNKPFSGQFVTRIPPELHRQVNLAASISGKSLNAWVAEQLQAAVAGVRSTQMANVAGKGNRTPKGVAAARRRSKQATHKEYDEIDAQTI
jgi:predicted HicB family RNase H-like nuclease